MVWHFTMTLVKILICGYIIKLVNFIILVYVMVHPSKEHFLYFAYGSNLLKRRIRINNPSAEFVGIGLLELFYTDNDNLEVKGRGLCPAVGCDRVLAEVVVTLSLMNHQLDFVKYFESWGGSVATIVPKENENVWGAVWKLHKDALRTLDKQEGVEDKEYFSKTVEIKTPDGNKSVCRTYQHTIIPPFRKPNEELPNDRRPSITYRDVIVKGAIECHLPVDYISMLKNIPSNGKLASPEIRKRLNI